MCKAHYEMKRKHNRTEKILALKEVFICSIFDCDRPYYAKNYCKLHYERVNPKQFHPHLLTRKKNFWKHFEKKESGCWEWKGKKDTQGYGKIVIQGKTYGVHRVAYQTHYGTLDEELLVRHKCDNPSCGNPYHLELGTHLDNMRDKVLRGRSKSSSKIKVVD